MINGEIFVKVYGDLCVSINALSVLHPFSNCLKPYIMSLVLG